MLALVPALLALLAPATAWGDIYKWIDERGNTVLSNVKPVNPDEVRNFQLAAKETRSSQVPAAAPQQAARPAETARSTEQLLLEKIESLERQVQAQQYAAQAQAVPQVINYYTPAPPPPPSYYDDPGYYPGYYYPPPVSYSYVVPAVPIVFPARKFVHRPAFVPKPAFVHRPAFGNRAIVNSGPVFVTPVRSSVAGASMQRARR